MDTAIILTDCDITEQPVEQVLVTRTANRIAHELDYRGSFVCMPAMAENSLIFSAIPEAGVGEAETERLFRQLAFDLNVDVTDLDGRPLFADSADNDLSFLERIPAPEETIPPLWLRFSLSNIRLPDPVRELKRMLSRLGYRFQTEADGLSVYLNPYNILDLYYDDEVEYIEGETDVTFSGAGIYLEAYQLANQIAGLFGGDIIFNDTDRITYSFDQDFDKLRNVFYDSLRQQLSLAAADDREGYQAFIGWRTDSYEPIEVAGSVITPLGRFKLKQLWAEIEKYGFEAVADQRFFINNYPVKGASTYMRLALLLMWSVCPFSDDQDGDGDLHPGENSLKLMDEAMRLDPYIRVPLKEYYELCSMLPHRPNVSPSFRFYLAHYDPIGYRKEKIYVGFGSYLRRFMIDGKLIWNEFTPGEEMTFTHLNEPSLVLECQVQYFDGGQAEPDDSFFENMESISSFDIGGSSICRYAAYESDEPAPEGDPIHVYWGRAEILIQDERYAFICTSESPDLIQEFRETIENSRAIEDVDDMPVEEGDKPRAPGPSFYRCADYAQQQSEDFITSRIGQLGKETDEYSCRLLRASGGVGETSSKLGGKPYLPEGVSIPCVKPQDGLRIAGFPMQLIAQINFAELPPMPDFPDRGLLQLFAYVPEGPWFDRKYLDRTQARFRVRYYDSVEPAPENPEDGGIKLEFERQTMAMTPADRRFDAQIISPLLHMTGKLSGVQLAELYDRFFNDGSRIGGYPYFYCSDPRPSCNRESIDGYDKLLMQLDSQDLGMPNLDPKGRPWILNLFISRESLLRRDFSYILFMWSRMNELPQEGI